MNAACGPPKPNGTPKRWLLPTTMSAPHSPGGASSVSASRSAATVTRPPRACTASTIDLYSRTSPVLAGYCRSTPKAPAAAAAASSPTWTSMPSGSARVRTTAIVCGWQSAATKKRFDLLLHERLASVIASAAAVPSSSNEALAISIAVRSQTMVWKFSSASIRPCEISAWYGV